MHIVTRFQKDHFATSALEKMMKKEEKKTSKNPHNYTKTPSVFQMEATECGAASLTMIFAYFGKYVPLEQMRIETGVSRDGCNAANIMRAAKRFGLDCHGYRKEPEALKTIKTPCIIH